MVHARATNEARKLAAAFAACRVHGTKRSALGEVQRSRACSLMKLDGQAGFAHAQGTEVGPSIGAALGRLRTRITRSVARPPSFTALVSASRQLSEACRATGDVPFHVEIGMAAFMRLRGSPGLINGLRVNRRVVRPQGGDELGHGLVAAQFAEGLRGLVRSLRKPS